MKIGKLYHLNLKRTKLRDKDHTIIWDYDPWFKTFIVLECNFFHLLYGRKNVTYKVLLEDGRIGYFPKYIEESVTLVNTNE